jgi:hypothetical protein
MKRWVFLSLLMFVGPVLADLPPTLRLDRRIVPAALPGYVQVLYTDANGYMAVRMRVKEGSRAKEQTLCFVLRPSSNAPEGVPANQWVSADAAILATPSYGLNDSAWQKLCANP